MSLCKDFTFFSPVSLVKLIAPGTAAVFQWVNKQVGPTPIW